MPPDAHSKQGNEAEANTARVLEIGMRLKSHGLVVTGHCKASDDDPTQIAGYFGFIHEAAVAAFVCVRVRGRTGCNIMKLTAPRYW